MSPWKYVFDQQLDIINCGIPCNFYDGKIVKDIHVPYLRKRYPERIMECDDSGELLIRKQLKEQHAVVSKATSEEPMKFIEEEKSSGIVEKVVTKPLVKEKKNGEKPKPEKKPEVPTFGIKNSAQLRNMFKEDLVDLCQKIGINDVGSKGALIKKISVALNVR